MTVKNPPVRQVIASPRRAGGTEHHINLGGFARGRKTRRHQWRIAFVNSPLPQRWLQFDYRDFKQAWVVGLLGHPGNMRCG